MQSNLHPCGLPIQQAGRPFYFVEVSAVDPNQPAPNHSALPPRSMYSRLPQVCLAGISQLFGQCPTCEEQGAVFGRQKHCHMSLDEGFSSSKHFKLTLLLLLL